MAASGIVGLFIEAVNADGSTEVVTEMRIVRFLWLYINKAPLKHHDLFIFVNSVAYHLLFESEQRVY